MIKIQKIVANFSGVTRNETMAGKEYLVAPAVMIVEGVLNGSNGPLLYPAEELKKSVPLWNNKPAVLYHPEANGVGVSACDPIIISNRGLGVMMNTKFEDNKLKTEVWLDMDRVSEIDERVSEAVSNNEVMELSTGLFTDNEEAEGEFNGVTYTGIARNYRPDHLALLPDQVGACSVDDGAGFLRLNKAGDCLSVSILLNEMPKEEKDWLLKNKEFVLKTVTKVVKNDMSDGDKRQLLYGLLNAGGGDDISSWIEEVFSEEMYFVYEREGLLFKQEFQETKGVISLKGVPTAVIKEISYKPIFNRKDSDMTKAKIVDGLIANNSTQWTDENREWLMTQEKDVLETMEPVANTEAEPEAEVKSENESETEIKPVENKQVSLDEYLANAPKELQGVLRNGLASYNADKIRFIGIITSNERNQFSEEQLKTKDLKELKAMAALACNSDSIDDVVANYIGQGDVATPVANSEEPLGLPTMNFATEE